MAGAGQLPVQVILTAQARGRLVRSYCIDKATHRALEKLLPEGHAHYIRQPGQAQHLLDAMVADGVGEVVFAGKINKWALLRSFNLDALARRMMRNALSLHDDQAMVEGVKVLEDQGMKVLPQADFIRQLFIAPGLYSRRQPTEQEQSDIGLAMATAREMGRLDIGQTAIVSAGMVIAVEAIEGTDKAIRRCKNLVSPDGGVVAKVEKPDQDQRFDIPTVGVKTLESLRYAGLTVLAVEAGKTLAVDVEAMQRYADKHRLTFVAV
ncbi:MAG: UDP-2,3-diacylglucosamine diphosphatase LpxI [Cyanobacteria bacterium HKST-UBA04]|nr:UDP-2,3-diacylglucosamine diphosphatase LpxI [Cyanobacteria bacterium HKST-UBA04]